MQEIKAIAWLDSCAAQYGWGNTARLLLLGLVVVH